ncbi:unnamed protein product [Pleuronectes platessa]|uniref:Uncharacterized protein n=1 Tax=Pleuronectes platessa TaxID=8262 RepID=A0A9N7U2P8_PLEPL|nr:unnamed protein product [Pleuronectes platessa]
MSAIEKAPWCELSRAGISTQVVKLVPGSLTPQQSHSTYWLHCPPQDYQWYCSISSVSSVTCADVDEMYADDDPGCSRAEGERQGRDVEERKGETEGGTEGGRKTREEDERAADPDPARCVDVFSGSASARAALAQGVHEKLTLTWLREANWGRGRGRGRGRRGGDGGQDDGRHHGTRERRDQLLRRRPEADEPTRPSSLPERPWTSQSGLTPPTLNRSSCRRFPPHHPPPRFRPSGRWERVQVEVELTERTNQPSAGLVYDSKSPVQDYAKTPEQIPSMFGGRVHYGCGENPFKYMGVFRPAPRSSPAPPSEDTAAEENVSGSLLPSFSSPSLFSFPFPPRLHWVSIMFGFNLKHWAPAQTTYISNTAA